MGTASLIAVIAGLATFYWLTLRPWFRAWGSVEAERMRPMAGDDVVTDPTYEATLAVTVDAPPQQIWPWLVQMGYRRGGLYSYDWLDRLFGYLDEPSADRILPEFQRLAVGDVIPIGRGGGFPVTAVIPCSALVLSGETHGVTWLWEFGLFPIDSRRTRLVSRSRVRAPRGLSSRLFMGVMEPAAFLMTRRMLLGLKSRAERLFRDFASIRDTGQEDSARTAGIPRPPLSLRP